jgi:activator of 2-hydroxyglutaryl-CoA dehydratase
MWFIRGFNKVNLANVKRVSLARHCIVFHEVDGTTHGEWFSSQEEAEDASKEINNAIYENRSFVEITEPKINQ